MDPNNLYNPGDTKPMPNDVKITQNFQNIHQPYTGDLTFSNTGAGTVPYDKTNRDSVDKTGDLTFANKMTVVDNALTPDRDPDINNQIVEKEPEEEQERETWGKKIEFLLAVIGFAVDLGNVWRFPYICYRNGGGAFLIPYVIMLITAGLPLFYMELALGQFQRCGCLTLWSRICPLFKGLGYAIIIMALYVSFYYNIIIAYALYYLFSSMASEVPWMSCLHDWNTANCSTFQDRTNQSLNNNYSLASSEEFYEIQVLGIRDSNGTDDLYHIGHLGRVKWELALCLIAVFVIVYFALWKGIKSSGKAVWVTATLPYAVLFVLMIRGCTLPGAWTGIKFYLTPKWDRLGDTKVWIDAASQVFFSLGPGFGVLLALSSYNKFHNNCYKDAIMTSLINCGTSFFAGFAVFSVLGYMAEAHHKDVGTIADMGPGLIFIAYPEAIAALDGSVFWAIIFFLMLITLGLDTTFGGLEALITGILDDFPKLRKKRELFVLVLIMCCFLGSLACTTYGGAWLVQLLDTHGATISILFVVFMETVAVTWFYGVNRFSRDIKEMLGFEPGLYWKVCWSFVSPLILFVHPSLLKIVVPVLVRVGGNVVQSIYRNMYRKRIYTAVILFVMSVISYEEPTYKGRPYPAWSVSVGWMVTMSSLICVPAYTAYKLYLTPGDDLPIKVHNAIQPTARPKHIDEDSIKIQPPQQHDVPVYL